MHQPQQSLPCNLRKTYALIDIFTVGPLDIFREALHRGDDALRRDPYVGTPKKGPLRRNPFSVRGKGPIRAF